MFVVEGAVSRAPDVVRFALRLCVLSLSVCAGGSSTMTNQHRLVVSWPVRVRDFRVRQPPNLFSWAAKENESAKSVHPESSRRNP